MPKYGNWNIHVIDTLVGTSETTIPHGMTRTPREGFIIRRDSGENVWRGSTAWDATNIYLQAGAADTSVRLALI